jgi:hypothetical protein
MYDMYTAQTHTIPGPTLFIHLGGVDTDTEEMV